MLQSINISIHILFGIIAIFIGLAPYFTKKGGRYHRLFGRLFIVLITVVIITAFNGVFFFRDRPFLTIVTLLSSYTTYSGYRVLITKEKGFTKQDFAFMLLVLGIAIYFLTHFQTTNVFWHQSVVYYLMGYFFLLVIFDIIRYFFPSIIQIKQFWLYEHIYKMTGSFSALISAGAGTVLVAYEPYNQIIPATLTTLWLIFCLIYFPRKFQLKWVRK